MDSGACTAIRALPLATDDLGAPDRDGPTKAEVKAALRAHATAAGAAGRTAYRAAHPELNPNASDATVEALMALHAYAPKQGGRRVP